MLLSLLNLSLIWLLSLLVYELLLKKETFHRLNRLYLLLTFIAGIVLPLLPWGQDVLITQVQAASPAATQITVDASPEAITAGAVAGKSSLPLNWWLIAYATGVIVSILYLLRELWRLGSLYRKAIVSPSGKWRIAETGVSHSPFSFLHIIFVCSREQYSDQQWAMLLQHEQQHYRHRHILDLLLMQAAQILLWFHPLVYIYRQKLLLLHEYEVDSTQPEDLDIYGRFLLEQAALSAAPAMAHSFNFSPLKNRIQMMTRTMSTRKAKYRLLLLLPMIAGFLYCCAHNKTAVQIEIKDDNAWRKDAGIAYKPGLQDTFYVDNLETGERKMVLTGNSPTPEKLNGRKILFTSELANPPVCLKPGKQFSMNYVVRTSGLEDIFRKLPDGTYVFSIFKTVIDPSGSIVFYQVNMPSRKTANGYPFPLNAYHLAEQDKTTIHRKLADVLMGDQIRFSAGTDKSGDIVPCYIESSITGFSLKSEFTVKDQQLTYYE